MPRHDAESPAYSPKALEIIAHANELIASGGYNGFSYADIAERVAVRKASIHHHFPAKADLVKATVALHREATRRGLDTLDDAVPDAMARLEAYAGFWAQCIEASNPPICICALLAAELPSLPVEVADEVKAHFEGLHAWVASVMEEGNSSGTLRLVGTPLEEASAFVASIHGAMLGARAVGDAALFGTIAHQALERFRPRGAP
ncbi:TetR/AcrR family transcriptional regulator [Dokdonella sp. MW10]|uniref:TetR/AcrR family transcriptional regulator n=1 Tax=Dokdonella sp. MW10 TaxID=2992926 RepID=UPI003F7DA489